MKRPKTLLAVGWIISLLYLVHSLKDPFGLFFWAHFYFFIIFTAGALFAFAQYTFTRKKWIVRILGLLPVGLALVLSILTVAMIFNYRWLLPGFPNKFPRAEEWKSDYEFLRESLYQHPVFKDSLDKSFLPSDSPDFAHMTKDETLVSFMKLAGCLPDGHTFVHPLQPTIMSSYFPLQGYWFDDGYFIVRAANLYKNLIGQRLQSINEVPLDDLKIRMDSLTGPENPWQSKNQFDLFIFSANVLHGLNVIRSVENCRVKVMDGSGKITAVNVFSEPFVAWFFWALKPIKSSELSPAKLNLRKPNYDLTYDPEHEVIFLPLHLIQNERKRSLAELSRELESMIQQRNPKKIIIDLRNSLGGNNSLYAPLINVLAKHSQRYKVYVLTGRKTFSASVNFISDLKKAIPITLVGEPTGAGPNHYGDAEHIFLPRTHLSVFISTRKWVFDSADTKRLYEPQIRVHYNYSDFQKNRDPWMEAVLN